MGEYTKALRYYQVDLSITEETGISSLQGRACANMGSVYECLGNLQESIRYQELYLSAATQANDKQAKAIAYSSLGK
jgi:tetratricopeptide (TPR) repeat protein